MNLRDRANSKNLRDKIMKNEEEKKSKKGGGDPRFLNYFDLPENGKMTIRLLPDAGDTGEYWAEYKVHGGGLKLRGVDNINCAYSSSGDDCPVCSHAWDFHNEGDKDEASRWRSNDKHLAQCIVMDSAVEVNETDDGNPIKLIHLPYKVYEILKEAVIEEQVGEIMDTDFIIKRTVGKNGRASYDKSYFAKSEDPLNDEILDAFESGDLVLFDLFAEAPDATTTEDMDKWLTHALNVDEKAARRSTRSSSKDDDKDGGDGDKDDSGSDDDKEESTPKKTSASALLNRLKNKDKNK